MKKVIFTLTISIILWSCGGGGGSDTPAPVNNAPTVPTLVYPTDNLLCFNNVLDFDWTASTDADKDAITYQIQVATDAQFTQLVHEVTTSATLKNLSLEIGTAYYWRVKATDGEDSSNYSGFSKFYTEGEGLTNYLPFSPVLDAPTLNSLVIGTSATLQWIANDVDTADVLTYDIYLGTDVNNLTIHTADVATTSLLVENLIVSTPYYWKVVVKDGQGGQTIGQIWNFTTN
tara:strand:+ start:11182 stop:11874 length:693 start_codon:yes stop_codon:yes gene_type:complete